MFVCAGLIEELANVTDLNLACKWKILLRRTASKISIFPLICEKGDKMSWPNRFEVLVQFRYSGLSDLRVSMMFCGLLIGAVPPN